MRTSLTSVFVGAGLFGFVAAACAIGGGNVCEGVDLPDRLNQDADCDGIDGQKVAAIFVAPTGNDLNPGTMDRPLRTISAAVALAQSAHKTQILVAVGSYDEPKTIVLADGVGIYGGYDAAHGWARTSDPSVVTGASLAMSARGLKLPTTLGRITVNAADGQAPGGSSIVLLATDATALSIEDQAVLGAGHGATGAAGTPGTKGTDGSGGIKGGGGNVDNQSQPGTGGSAGENADCAEANGGVGGKGGQSPSFAGSEGSKSAAGVSGGPGGSTGSCSPQDGTKGDIGANDGDIAVDGKGGAAFGAFDPQTYAYQPANGVDGTDGVAGPGGGGGGGSSGQTSTWCIDGAGNGGGGGGAGGCGGTKGLAGTGGGASIAIVSIRSTLTLDGAQLVTLGGGAGGSGGTGGDGGLPGTGGAGGDTGTGEIGTGGPGGDGRKGGRGGAGGGGGGGPSVGIWVEGLSPEVKQAAYTVGPAGFGGTSSGATSAGKDGLSKEIGP